MTPEEALAGLQMLVDELGNGDVRVSPNAHRGLNQALDVLRALVSKPPTPNRETRRAKK